MVLTTHDMDEADLLCDDISIIDHGKITVRDTPNNLEFPLEGEKITVRISSPEIRITALTGSDYILDIYSSLDTIAFKVKDRSKNAIDIINTAKDAGVMIEFRSVNQP